MVLLTPFADAATITINTNISGPVYGNGVPPNGSGTPSQSDVEDYHVIVNSNGSVSLSVYGGSANSFGGSATATGNKASVSGTVGYSVYGGIAGSGHGSATATGNEASVSGGAVGGFVYGGIASSGIGSGSGSGSGSATATGNTVTISGGAVGGSVYGGSAQSNSGSATATGNTVTINGGAVSGSVYGGSADSNSGSATATGNTVTINGDATFDSTSVLYGGYATGGGDAFTGNKLHLNSGTVIPTVQNFEIINFGDIGTAGITTLDVTPTGAASGTLVKLNTGDNDITFSGKITGNGGGIEKTGEGTLTLSGTNTHNGGTTVSEGVLQIGNGGVTGSIVGNILNNANVTFNRSDAVTYAGVISGTGSLTKTGAGTLTLSGVNSYTGDTVITVGTLALTGSLTTTRRLSMHGGTAFDFTSGTAPTSIARLDVQDAGARLSGGGKTLDFNGKTISFDIGGATANDTMLYANAALNVDGATLELDGLESVLLGEGEHITLIADPLGAFDSLGATRQIGRRTYGAMQTGADADVFLAMLSKQKFTDHQDGQLDWSNVNLVSGAGLLDRLEAEGHDMTALETVWEDSLGLGGSAAVALEQMYGGYGAYANTGLQVSTDRFRSLWQRRNASHLLDRHIFANTAASGVASQDAFASPAYGQRNTIPSGRSRIWASGFGSWAEQNAAENLSGYKWDAQGFALGYEYSFNNCLQIGFGAAYSKGELKVSNLRYENNPDILNLALYGVYAHPSGFYAQGGLGYGHAWNEYDVNMLLGGKKSGKYGSDDVSANLEFGYAAKLPCDFTLTPSIGIEYDRLRNDGWTERTSGNPALIANRFDSDSDDSLGVPLGLRLGKLIRFGANGGYAVPEVRAAYVYQADNSRPSIGTGYSGAPGSAPMVGVKPGRSHWRLGAGVSGRFNERVDFRVDYDFDARSDFRGHNLLATVGVSF